MDEIIAYQLAVKLRDKVIGLIDSGAIPFNYRLREQLGDSARSVPANISEGFDRYKHGQFAYHVGVAKGSLGELHTHLKEVRKRDFITETCFTELLAILIETRKTTSGLLRHLHTTQTPQPWHNESAPPEPERPPQD